MKTVDQHDLFGAFWILNHVLSMCVVKGGLKAIDYIVLTAECWCPNGT